MSSSKVNTLRPWLVAALLTALTLLIFLPVLDFEYVDFDDNLTVKNNPEVLAGLSAKGLAWAFTTFHSFNWQPLTWLSHMLDVTLFGPAPRGPHLVNLLFHAANAVLLLTLLARLTGAFWKSLLVALLFAVHPLHVESVAWVSERKDLLLLPDPARVRPLLRRPAATRGRAGVSGARAGTHGQADARHGTVSAPASGFLAARAIPPPG